MSSPPIRQQAAVHLNVGIDYLAAALFVTGVHLGWLAPWAIVTSLVLLGVLRLAFAASCYRKWKCAP